jgi:16S rRNA (guanine527-N7)-methyltransferase
MTVPRGTFGQPDLPVEAASTLARYADLVRRWSARLNLVSPGDLEQLESRHISDCLRLLPLARSLPPGPAIDVGSGAGLPGVVLAAADRSRPWRLLEPHQRRAAFLEELVRALELDAEVVVLRAEAAARRPDLAGGHVLATARAVAAPEDAFRMMKGLVCRDGVCAVMVGRGARIPAEAEVWNEGIAIIRSRTAPSNGRKRK